MKFLKFRLRGAICAFSIAMLFISAPVGWAQNAKVSVSVKNVSLEKLFETLEQQTDYRFSYDSEVGKRLVRQSIDDKKIEVKDLLNKLLPSMGLEYRMASDKVISISRSGSSKATLASSKSAKTSTVSGRVTDNNGEPLTGATVQVVGTNKATVADLDGNYSIDVAPGETLKVTIVGMIPYNVKVRGDKTHYDVVLRGDNQTLDQVVVVGYGTMQKKRVTSAITSVSGEDLMKGVGGSSIATALQGKVSGLTISGSASPNSGNGYQLRGVSSVKGGTSPLVVIDGVPGGDLRAINQDDVESIDVLKDASAGAIYGTRASAGVILVTTKKAKEGKATITYNGEFSIETTRKKLELLTPEEYLGYGRGTDYGARTDWYDLLCRDTPFSQKHTVTLTGGTKNLSLYSSLIYNDQKGIVIGDGRRDYSVRMNGRYTTWDNKLEVGIRTQYRETQRDQRNSANTFEQTLGLNPTVPLMDPDAPDMYNVNQVGIGNDFYNPVAHIMDQDYHGTDQWFIGDLNVTYNILSGLKVQANAGVDRRQWVRTQYYNQNHLNSVNSGKLGQAEHAYQKDLNFNYEAFASYYKDFGDSHHLDAVAGWSYYKENGMEKFSMLNRDFTVDGIGPWDIGAGKDLGLGQASMNSSKDATEHLLSWYGRVNYSFEDRYIGTVSYRREGSSKFGKNHRWGNFWSVSGAWRINREKFMQDVEWLNELKLRAGYGVTGNDQFDAGHTVYNFISDGVYPTPGGLAWGPAYKAARNANPDLKWEEKKEFNVGLDFGFFDNRLTGKFDWFSRTIDDMLFAVTAPAPPMTSKTIMKNVGSLSNRGWEFELTGKIFQTPDFDWSATVRFSSNRSKIDNLGEESSQVLSDALPQSMGNTHKLVNGQQIGQFWLYKVAGLDEDGQFLIYDKDNNVVPAKGNDSVDNKHYVGNGVPKMVFSMDHMFRYRNFDLGINCHSYIDFDVFDQVNLYYGLQNMQGVNVLKSAYADNAAVKGNRLTCDYFLSDASFFKIDAISLGYSLNLSKWQKYVQSMRVYLTIRDVATFSKFKGYNPEQNVNGLFPGEMEVRNTQSMYPQTTHWTLGVQLKF